MVDINLDAGRRVHTIVVAGHPSLTRHTNRYTAGVLKSYSFTEEEFFTADGAPPEIAALRKAGFTKLGKDVYAYTHSPPRTPSYTTPTPTHVHPHTPTHTYTPTHVHPPSHSPTHARSSSSGRLARRWRRELRTDFPISDSPTPTACPSHSKPWWVSVRVCMHGSVCACVLDSVIFDSPTPTVCHSRSKPWWVYT